MADTYSVHHRDEAPPIAMLRPDVDALSGMDSLWGNSMLAVFNGTGSGKIVNVFAMGVEPWSSSTSATTPVRVSLSRITAYSGGEPVTAFKPDSEQTALDGAITCAKYPAGVTVSGSPIRMLTVGLPELAPATMWSLPLGLGQSMRSNTGVLFNAPDTSAQALYLRPGQGIAINSEALGPAIIQPLEIVVWIVAGGLSYRYCTVVSTVALCYLALINGSGADINVTSVTVNEIRTADLALFAVERIEALDLAGGVVAESVVAHDSATSLPGSVAVRAGAMACLAGQSVGALISHPTFRRSVGAAGPYGPNTGAFPFPTMNRFPYNARTKNAPWVLREAQGLALFARSAGMIGCFCANAMFTVEDAAGGAPASSGGSYTWMG